MQIGLPKEVKDKERRVAITPNGVRQLCENGHSVVIEQGAGLGSGFDDEDYLQAGGDISSLKAAWSPELVVKVKEPMPAEYPYLNGQILFTYLHLAGVSRSLTQALLTSNTTAIAYETLEDAEGRLPLLAPMSAVAGNMATLMGAYYLAQHNGGSGVQLGQILGEAQGKVVIIGDGVVGQHAAAVACGMGAEVFMLGHDLNRGQHLCLAGADNFHYQLSNKQVITDHLACTDLLIGAVLSPGKQAPQLVTENMVKKMRKGSVIVDVSIDQGGCIETSKPTSHSNPVFVKHGITHYCVTNMPGAYPRTSTLALTKATLPYILELANNGLANFIAPPNRAKALNIFAGKVCCFEVAEALNLESYFAKAQQLIPNN